MVSGIINMLAAIAIVTFIDREIAKAIIENSSINFPSPNIKLENTIFARCPCRLYIPPVIFKLNPSLSTIASISFYKIQSCEA